MNKIRYLVVITGLLLSTICINTIYSMGALGEEVVGRAATEALGEGAMEGLEKGAVESLAKRVADEMGVSVEEIGALPEETKAAFQERLAQAFKEVRIEGGVFKFPDETLFKNTIADVRGKFVGDVRSIAEQQSGFSSLKEEALKKFGVQQELFERFPYKPKVPEVPGFKGVEGEVSSAEKQLENVHTQLADAKDNLSYAKSIKDEGAIKTAQEHVEGLEKQFNELDNKIIGQKEALVKSAEQEVSKADKVLEQAKAKGDPAAIEKAEINKAEVNNNLEIKKEEAVLAKRKSLASKYEEAKKTKTASETSVKEAQEDLKAAQKTGDTEKIGKAQKALTDAQEADHVAGEDLSKAEKEFLETKSEWSYERLKGRAKSLLVEHIVNGVVGGFAFSIPNIIIQVIEGAMNIRGLQDQLKRPQRFGGVWMQIPSDLINYAVPASSKYIYVGLEKKATDDVPNHVDDADTDSYFKKANFYLSINDYDEYAAAAITDPNFPNAMVHANTGYHFASDGLPYDPTTPVVPLLEATQRAKSLQVHLDDQAGQVLRGVSGEIYNGELRWEQTGYKGNKTIADRFDQTKNKNIPYDIKPPNAYGEVLTPAVQLGPIFFGPYTIEPITALSDKSIQKIANSTKVKGPLNLPYIALKQYGYQTADTPLIQMIIKNTEDTATKAYIKDYIVAFDREYRQIPLHTPLTTSEYGFASYALNPNVMVIGSLLSEKMYDKSGKELTDQLIDTSKLLGQALGSFEVDLQSQIIVMKQYVKEKSDELKEKMKYGPISIGSFTLSIPKELFDKGVYVYTIPKALEDGSSDYVVAMALNAEKHPVVSPLPNDNVITFISLITSRFYDNVLVPYDKAHAGQKDTSYIVYKQPNGAFMLATGAANETYGEQLFSGKAPLYSIFMDATINPNKPTSEQQALLRKNGATEQESTLLPLPEQWALSNRGPVVDAANNVRIGDLITKVAPDFQKLLNKVFSSWRVYMEKLDPKAVQREMGPYRFTTDLLRNIVIRPTSVDDVSHGNYVYVSDYYAGEYLVLSNDPDGKDSLDNAYDLGSPQRYAISLSSGKVYDSKQQGQEIKILNDLNDLLQRAQASKPFLPALLKKVKDSQAGYTQALDRQEYSIDTQFGPFKFFIDKQDLQRGNYIYGDVSSIKDPLTMDRKKLFDTITDYFICIKSPDGTDNSGQWVYGTKLGPDTYRVISLVTGSLYDRGGTFQGWFNAYGASVDKNIDINTGFLQNVYGYAKVTWGTDVRSELKERILALTQKQYDKLVQERKEIAQAQEKEAKLYAPMNATLKANIDAQEYEATLKAMVPPRYIKKYNNQYYAVPAPEEQQGIEPIYIDYNVGDANKDNGVGMSYDGKGLPVIRLTGWNLDVMRAYAGIVVQPNGKQVIDIAVDHPQIPVGANMVAIDVASATKKLSDARNSFKKASDALANTKTEITKEMKDSLFAAAVKLGYAKQEYKSALAVKRAGIPTSKSVSYDFYFNETIGSYFVRMKTADTEVLIDLVAGYVYDVTGLPALRTFKTLVNASNNALLFVGEDQNNLFMATYMGEDNIYHSWTLKDKVLNADKTEIKYTMQSNEADQESIIVYNKKTGEYSVYGTNAKGETVKLGVYKPGNLVYSNLHYTKTITKSDANGTYVQDDEPFNPILLIWDGKPSLALQSIFYKQQLIPLKGSGDSYSGSYKEEDSTKPITVTKQKKQLNSRLQAHWVSIVDGDKTYVYLYDTQVLDPEAPVVCPTTNDEVYDVTKLQLKLNYWKECAWNLNSVTDSFGVSMLVNSIPISNLLGVDSASIQGVPNKPEVKSVLNKTLARISYDKNNDRYVYQFDSSDEKWSYYQSKFIGWYVDLNNGILFDQNGYPRGSLLPSQLYLLLDRLSVAVVPVADPNGEQIYDNQGNAVIDQKTGKPLKAISGLGYRTTQVVTQETKKQAPKKAK